MNDERIGLPSGRGAEAGGKCLMAQYPEPAGPVTIAFNVAGLGNVRGHVCRDHANYVKRDVLTGLTAAVEPNIRPARPE